jgi:hypothetical protein
MPPLQELKQSSTISCPPLAPFPRLSRTTPVHIYSIVSNSNQCIILNSSINCEVALISLFCALCLRPGCRFLTQLGGLVSSPVWLPALGLSVELKEQSSSEGSSLLGVFDSWVRPELVDRAGVNATGEPCEAARRYHHKC